MIVHESIEIALLWAQQIHRENVVLQPISGQVMKDYWSESRKRFDVWSEDLRLFRIQLEGQGAARRAELWQLLTRTIEEILTAEVLTRTIACVTDVLELHEVDYDSSAISNNIYVSHTEVRNRALHLLVDGPGQPIELAASTNQLRFALEGITDCLLARTMEVESADKFCFNSNRVRELIANAANEQSLLRWALLTNAIRQHLRNFSANAARQSAENRTVNHLALRAIRPSWFRVANSQKSLSAIRMENLVEETDDLVSGIASDLPPMPNIFASYESFSRRCAV